MKIMCENCRKEIKGKIFTTDDGYHLCRKCVREINKEESTGIHLKPVSTSLFDNPWFKRGGWY